MYNKAASEYVFFFKSHFDGSSVAALVTHMNNKGKSDYRINKYTVTIE